MLNLVDLFNASPTIFILVLVKFFSLLFLNPQNVKFTIQTLDSDGSEF